MLLPWTSLFLYIQRIALKISMLLTISPLIYLHSKTKSENIPKRPQTQRQEQQDNRQNSFGNGNFRVIKFKIN